MTIEEAKQVRIVDFLAQLGHHAQYVKSDQYWYLSPLRDEQSPTLCKLLHNVGYVSNFIM